MTDIRICDVSDGIQKVYAVADIAERRTFYTGMMPEYSAISNKDLLAGKSSKKPVLIWRMLFLIFMTICGLYMFSVCVRQRNMHVKSRYILGQVLDTSPCQKPVIRLEESVSLHFPLPRTHTRDECACTPVHYFAILSMQRSGSGLELNLHCPEILENI